MNRVIICSRCDFDHWAKLGNAGWSYEDVLPYFKKSENMLSKEILSLPNSERYHGTSGPLYVTSVRFQTPIIKSLIQGNLNLGMGEAIDYNRGDSGFGFVQKNMRNGTRVSAAKAFLTPAKHRENLHVVRKALVKKILISERSKTAIGVEFLHEGQIHYAYSSKEVILSAGVVNSPHILMLSGVGPEEHLKEMGVSPVISDLQVGRNLKDHSCFEGILFEFPKTESNKLIPDLTDAMYVYLRNRTGPLNVAAYGNYRGRLRMGPVRDGCDGVDVELHPTTIFDKRSARQNFGRPGMDPSDIKLIEDLSEKYDLLLIAVCLTRPHSIGRIKLRSRNVEDPPLLSVNYMTDERDVETAISGTKFLVKLGQHTPGLVDLIDVPVSRCSNKERLTPDYWRCVLPYLTSKGYHAAGTCHMGPKSDPESVVDSELRVRGVDKLRVVDASIMPDIISGNTNAAVIMTAERASNMIKKKWT